MENEKKIVRHDSETGRFYEIDGQFYPSATTILEAYPMSFYLREFLQENTKAEAERKKNEAAIRGSKIHHTIELILAGRVVSNEGITLDQIKFLGLTDQKLIRYLQEPFTEREDTMMRGFMQFWEDYTPKVIKSEEIVFSTKYRFAGTLDSILKIYLPQTAKSLAAVKESGKKTPPRKSLKVLVDFKTGKALYPEYDLQVGAYWQALKEMGRVKGKVHVALLQLGINKCGYKFKFVEDPKKAFQDFLKVKETWEMVNPNAAPKTYEFLPEYGVKLK